MDEQDWLPAECRRRGCRVAIQYDIRSVAHRIAHWHPDETTAAGVEVERTVDWPPRPGGAAATIRTVRDELARVAHLPDPPADCPAYGVRWYRQRTAAEVLEG